MKIVDNEMPRGGSMWALAVFGLLLVGLAESINFVVRFIPSRKKPTTT